MPHSDQPKPLINLYDKVGAGVRMESEVPHDQTVIDIGAYPANIYMCDAVGNKVRIELTVEDIWHLREGLNRILVDLGHERTVTVNVPA
jgi:hypothetical protein